MKTETKKEIARKIYKLCRIKNHKYAKFIPTKLYLKCRTYVEFGKWPNISHPVTFNEKLHYLKIHDKKPLYTTMVDKYEAKKYVSDIIGEEYIVPNYGVYDSFDEIDFDALPDQFVLKCTHDSNSVCICRDKKHFDFEAAKEKISKRLTVNPYWISRETPYKKVKPRIIAEKYMEDCKSSCLTDYKFYCFDGVPKFLYVSSNLEDHSQGRISFLTLDWNFMPFVNGNYQPFEELPEKPLNFEKMLDAARTLSKGIKFLRVDLYEINNKMYFSELTFYPGGGFNKYTPDEYDSIIGDMINI